VEQIGKAPVILTDLRAVVYQRVWARREGAGSGGDQCSRRPANKGTAAC